MAKYDLIFDNPVINAAGSLGFSPGKHSWFDLSLLGAFVTNPVSLKARTPAHGTRFLNFPSGFLVHSGYPNPGLKTVVRRHSKRWSRSPLPMIVHLLAQKPAEVTKMVQLLERVEGVMGIELGIDVDMDSGVVAALVRAASGELPVIVRTPLERAVELSYGILGTGVEEEIVAISLGPPRGVLPDPGGRLVHGRLFGPALFPMALAVVEAVSKMGMHVIGAGGIYSRKDTDTMLAAGAMAVQLDTVLWRGGL